MRMSKKDIRELRINKIYLQVRMLELQRVMETLSGDKLREAQALLEKANDILEKAIIF